MKTVSILITTLTILVALNGCSSLLENSEETTTTSCIDHPPSRGFQNIESKVCYLISAPSCVEHNTNEDDNDIRLQIVAEKSKPYENEKHIEFAPDSDGTIYGRSEVPSDCIDSE